MNELDELLRVGVWWAFYGKSSNTETPKYTSTGVSTNPQQNKKNKPNAFNI